MKSWRSDLLRPFSQFYAGVAFFSVIGLNCYNVFVDGSTWSHIFKLDFYFILVTVTLFFFALQSYTFSRLRSADLYFLNDPSSPISETLLLQRLLRFPAELFVAVWGCSTLSTVVYHTMELAVLHLRSFDIYVVQHILVEQALGLTLAMMMFGTARRILRPYLLRAAKTSFTGLKETTFFNVWLGTFVSFLLAAVLAVLWSSINSMDRHSEVNIILVLCVAAITISFAVVIFRSYTSDFRDELNLITAGIRSLATGQGSRLHQQIPIISLDETGQLTAAFNRLQERISGEYAELERERRLAYDVQQKLLPSPLHEIGRFQMACYSKAAREVGGDLYDVVMLPDDRFAVMVGDVSGKGMQAALIMSSVMMLFRTEVRRGGGARELMVRLNRRLVETLRGEHYVTLGLAICNCRKGSIVYASGGHVGPYHISEDRMDQIILPSLPLGIHEDEEYKEQEIILHGRDRFLMYTDGTIESMDEEGEMIGFEFLEHMMLQLSPDLEPQHQVDRLIAQLPKMEGSRYEDDRTIVLLQYR